MHGMGVSTCSYNKSNRSKCSRQCYAPNTEFAPRAAIEGVMVVVQVLVVGSWMVESEYLILYVVVVLVKKETLWACKYSYVGL